MTPPDPTDFVPSRDQGVALDAVGRFVADRSGARQVLTLHGLAGTGKTTVLAEAARRYPGSTLCAPTGKAAAVLRGKVGRDVATVHSAIYDFRGLSEDEETGRKQPIFTAKENAGLGGLLVFLDECSMVGTRLAHDLLATGARVIACGDPGQLKPVADDQFFERGDLRLTQIHRQALESAIVRQAHRVREVGDYRSDGPDFRVTAGIAGVDLLGADVALCWRNATRRALNDRARRERGLGGPALRAGEPVMCLRNDYRLRVFNGEIYSLARDRAPGDDALLDVGDGRTVEVLNALVEGCDAGFEELRHEEERTPLALAYAATVHKAQGSEWESVLLVDEHRDDGDRRAFLYTGITRAAKRVVVVRSGR